MNRRYSILSITAVAVIAATLFGSTYSQSQMAGNAYSVSRSDTDLMQKIHAMGGLQLVMPSAFAQVPLDQVDAMVAAGHPLKEFSMTAQSVDLPIMGGGKYHAMTWNGQVPGPTVRVTQGDLIKVTVTVPDTEPTMHGLDMHASQMSAGNFGAVKQGTSTTYAFIAEIAGTFKYHCSGVNVAAMDQHVLSGMYGMTIVDPINGYKKLMVEKTYAENGKVEVKRTMYEPDALEFQLQYNQLYLDKDGAFDESAMFMHHATQNVVNGMALGYVPNADLNKLIKGDENKNIFVLQPWNSKDLKQYQSQLIYVPTGVHTRLFIENQGNEPVFFHIVGEIIDRVVQGNRVQAQGTETWLVGGSQGATMDVVFDNPGVYVAVNHDYAAIFSGAATIFVAGNPFGLDVKDAKSYAEVLGNPSDAVPPMGMNSMKQEKLNLHGLYTDARAAEIAKELGIQ